MDKFTQLTGLVAPLDRANVDTDAILPARYLLMLDRRDAAAGLFRDRRQQSGAFVLDQEPFQSARIILGGANFGCGSSREQAPWALVDNGVTCVIAHSFGDIFHANCIRNGILPVVLSPADLARLYDYCIKGAPITVDLESCCIRASALTGIEFQVDPGARAALLNGWDETETILRLYVEDIAAFEQAQTGCMPWLHDEPGLAGALPAALSFPH